MVEPAKLRGILRNLDGYVAKLHILRSCSREEFLQDFTKVESAKHLLQVSVECCIDACHHVIASEGWRAPRNYVDAFVVLNEQGVLPDDFLPVARQMVRFRNRLVHLYWEVDDEIVYQILQTNLGDFDRFARYMEALISVEEED